MPSLSLQIDPNEVLGIAPGATLREIREAYHRKAKAFHPDAGGEEWAFRVLVWAYESLSTERVARATRAEFDTRGPRRAATVDEAEAVYPNSGDAPGDPHRVVEVEKLWIRTDPGHDWMFLGGGNDDRFFLSCSLNIHWPASAAGEPAGEIPDADATLGRLAEVVKETGARTRTVSSSFNVEDQRFYGWLSYSNVNQAWEAFQVLRESLHARGFTLKQWTRDLTVPRQGR
jgi:hypothetical protein